MKKALIVILAVVLVFSALAASEPSPPASAEPSDMAGVPNPVVPVDGPEAIEEQLGIYMYAPEEATDVQYSIIDDRVAQVDFVMDGRNYTARIEKTPEYEDISGYYTGFKHEKDMDWIGYEYHIAYNVSQEGVATWYDTFTGCSYSVSMDSGATARRLERAAIMFIPAG